jgi:hypothetical protein
MTFGVNLSNRGGVRLTAGVVLLAVATGLTACGAGNNPPTYRSEGSEITNVPLEERQTIFGPGGFNLFGDEKKNAEAGTGAGLGVNAYLWRATLDTVSIWPVTSADPFGGVIITDWYAPPESPNERFKMNVYILDRALRADGVRVALFRQIADRTGNWRDAPVLPSSAVKLENAILNRARQCRNQTLQQ